MKNHTKAETRAVESVCYGIQSVQTKRRNREAVQQALLVWDAWPQMPAWMFIDFLFAAWRRDPAQTVDLLAADAGAHLTRMIELFTPSAPAPP